jgi:hypothetical protein
MRLEEPLQSLSTGSFEYLESKVLSSNSLLLKEINEITILIIVNGATNKIVLLDLRNLI